MNFALSFRPWVPATLKSQSRQDEVAEVITGLIIGIVGLYLVWAPGGTRNLDLQRGERWISRLGLPPIPLQQGPCIRDRLKTPGGRVTRVPNRAKIAEKVRDSCNSSLRTQGFETVSLRARRLRC